MKARIAVHSRTNATSGAKHRAVIPLSGRTNPPSADRRADAHNPRTESKPDGHLLYGGDNPERSPLPPAVPPPPLQCGRVGQVPPRAMGMAEEMSAIL